MNALHSTQVHCIQGRGQEISGKVAHIELWCPWPQVLTQSKHYILLLRFITFAVQLRWLQGQQQKCLDRSAQAFRSLVWRVRLSLFWLRPATPAAHQLFACLRSFVARNRFVVFQMCLFVLKCWWKKIEIVPAEMERHRSGNLWKKFLLEQLMWKEK